MKFKVFMIDPPWRQFHIYERSQLHLGDNIPPKMINAMRSFGFLEDCLKQLSSSDHIVFIWVTEKYTQRCREYIKHLGYQYHKYLIWVRPKWKRGTTKEVFEYLMIYYKGALLPQAGAFPDPLKSAFTGRVKNRQTKPPDAYAMIEGLYPNSSKIQIFGKAQRPGWHSFHYNNDKFK
jgi:N6-adenosine-specific RNA methylase IME4